MNEDIGIVVLTLNASAEIAELLAKLIAEAGRAKILVVDSSSTDGTHDLVRRFNNVELYILPRGEFNHGATREFARKRLNCEVVVFLTQDVIPCEGWLERLVAPVRRGTAVVSYARQLPHVGADIFEAFPREFNYPATSHQRGLRDAAIYGVYMFFCSNSCAAYLNRALDEIGGFENTLTNEDYFAVAKLLKAGGQIAYVAESEVHHSHRYTLKQEFQRYFDTGYVRAENPWVTQLVGQAEKRGASMASAFLKRIAKTSPFLLPYAVLQLAAKWTGYRAGYFAYRWPRKWCKRCSSQPYYWDSKFCRHPRA